MNLIRLQAHLQFAQSNPQSLNYKRAFNPAQERITETARYANPTSPDNAGVFAV